MIIQVIGAFIAVVALSIIFSIPKKFLVYSGIVGAVGWFIYLVFLRLKFQETTSVFIATLVVALISHSFARIFKAPVTVFLIAGILPMVPGVGMYRIAYSMLSEESGMAAYYFNHTLQIAGLIAIAIFIMDTFFRMVQKR